eukprot:TRINITY_DN10383_c0_g1_i4.p1 TRINITY_DN10383_c0_g1~~TRINITY_DN10383_c0_g1_i4.p1  ORF type:complete len:202 (-),score=48.41 TRINITY_DN10383_c0_g1_i4:88-693(-)
MVDRPLRLCISDVFRAQSSVTQIAGKLESGSLMPNERVMILPLGEAAVAKTVTIRGQPVKIARAGELVEVGLQGLSDPSILTTGHVLCPPDQPVPLISHFEARILTLGMRIPILQGTQVELHAHAVEVSGQVFRLLSTGKKDAGERPNPRQVTKNSTAIVEIKVERSIPLELYSDLRSLGRFMIRRQGETIAVGVVTRLIS